MPDSIPLNFEVLALSRDIPSPYVAPDGSTGAPYIVARGVQVISDIHLTPETATNPVGTSHTLTATVTEGGTPTSGKTVTFQVISGPHTGVTGTGVTNASGQATFSYTGTLTGTDVIQATFVDSSQHTQRSNRAEKTWTPRTDTTPPTCVLDHVAPGPPTRLYVRVQDTGSGLGTIVVTESTNAVTPVPAFTPGTTDPVMVIATKINQNRTARVALRVTDVAGNVTLCDPILAKLRIGKASKTTQSYAGLPRAESKVRLMNLRPGVRSVTLVVNGRYFTPLRLAPGARRMINVARAMRPGNRNRITVIARGASGASVSVVISD
jgi:hypothetical protein